MMRFKVGDRVRVKKGKGCIFYEEGAEGRISSIDRDGHMWVTFDRGVYASTGDATWCASVHRLDLCPAETPKKTPRRYVVNPYNEVVDKGNDLCVASCPTRAIARTIARLLNAEEAQ